MIRSPGSDGGEFVALSRTVTGKTPFPQGFLNGPERGLFRGGWGKNFLSRRPGRLYTLRPPATFSGVLFLIMPESNEIEEPGWYCVRTRPKSEHLAARNLIGFANLDEVFCPRIRFEKSTRRGKVWFVEALFPGYIFARFDLANDLRAVNAATGVTGVLRFADEYPLIEHGYIQELREEFPEEDDAIRIIEPEIAAGDEVVITEGAMAGLKTIVTRLISGQDRVRVLLEWLGEEREAEVPLKALNRPGEIRTEIRPSTA